MKGKLFGIGVGPGDPELLTIKAKRILEEVSCIAVPVSAKDKQSLALSIVEEILEIKQEKLELYFPMSFEEKVLGESWQSACMQVKAKLEEGKNVGFITLGDPTIYSTFMYLYKRIKLEGYDTEIIPGITSFCAGAARAGVSLAENRETIAIIPSAYECENLNEVLGHFDNIVLMKVSKDFEKLKMHLKEKNLLEKSLLVSKCSMKDESIQFDLNNQEGNNISYFSTIIVKKGGIG